MNKLILPIFIYAICKIGANSFKHIYHINDFLWRKRVLIVKSEIKDKEITKFYRFSKGILERDILVVKYQRNQSLINNNPMKDSFHSSVSKIIDSIDKRFCCVLIGKDGGVKESYLSILDTSKMFSDIDKMPMRRIEMLKQ